MKKILLGIIAINLTIISIDTNAFEFKGIKSGMTKEEVESASGIVGGVAPSESERKAWLPELSKIAIDTIDFAYNHENKLWRIVINFKRNLNPDPEQTAGYQKALKSFCDAVDFNAPNILRCLMIDGALFDESSKHWENFMLEHLK